MAEIESDDELGEPALPPAALGANPFSPVAAASGNEQRLVQVLENLTTLVANQAAPREQGIRGRDLAKVLKAPEAFRPKDGMPSWRNGPAGAGSLSSICFAWTGLLVLNCKPFVARPTLRSS